MLTCGGRWWTCIAAARCRPLLSLLCACGLVALLWKTLSGPAVGLWLLAHGLVAASRLLLVGRFNRERVGDGLLLRWRAYYVNATLVAGLVWGIGSVLLVARAPHVLQVLAWVVLSAAVLVEFPALARLGRAFAWLLIATLAAPLALMLLGPQPLPAGAGALLLLACSSALAGLELRRTYIDGLQMQVEFARLARFDQLTGLANRRHFDETLAGEWQRALRLRGEVALVIFDVDEFKPYNDHYGHPGGDACLRRLAAAARELVHRHGDLVVRLGGEEFGVLLPLTPASGASAVADMLRQAVENLRLPHAPGATPSDGHHQRGRCQPAAGQRLPPRRSGPGRRRGAVSGQAGGPQLRHDGAGNRAGFAGGPAPARGSALSVWAGWVLPPLIGAVIGGVTNDVAIRMLFRPYAAVARRSACGCR